MQLLSIYTATIFCFLCSLSFSQRLPPGEIPLSVGTAFDKLYKGAQEVDWEEKIHGFYEVDFKMDGKKKSAIFNANGLLMHTKVVVPSDQVPTAIIKNAMKNYPDYKITEYGRITAAGDRIMYELEILKGKDRKSLMYDINNNYVGEEYFNDDDPLKRN